VIYDNLDTLNISIEFYNLISPLYYSSELFEQNGEIVKLKNLKCTACGGPLIFECEILPQVL